MDDVHDGKDSIPEIIQSRDEMIAAMKGAGIELRKWASNDPSILKSLPSEHLEKATKVALDRSEETVKTLGLFWDPSSDTFQYNSYARVNREKIYTKREMLTMIAQIFDALGWVQPLIISAKILMQETWKRNLAWDDPLPIDLNDKWICCSDNFHAIESLRIPRWIHYSSSTIKCELHGFSDASQSAYGAAIYIKITQEDGSVTTKLLIAKSRVAPIKPVTIPRLELCAAVLLCELLEKVTNALCIPNIESFGWTDSQIVLAWIHSANHDKWKPFVRNRVTQICNTLEKSRWNYVNTKENPADLISRGCGSSALNALWWTGPIWLREWHPNMVSDEFETNEEARPIAPISLHVSIVDDNILVKYSSFGKTCRIVSYVLRFINNCRKTNVRKEKSLSDDEAENGKTAVITLIQKLHFSQEMDDLKKNGCVDKKSKLRSLCPILDHRGLIRVGGRLENALLPFESKHPIIMPPQHSLTRALVSEFHKQTLHGTNALTLNAIRQQYWITQGAKVVRAVINKCVRCHRNKSQMQQQLMGQLPASRVNPPTKAFAQSSVDFAGPVYIRTRAGRGAKAIKAYIAVFVCMAFKAIHLELVSSMTSVAFIAAFKRFIARRGTVSDMWSDNGTNFVGAFKKLTREWEEYSIEIESFCESAQEFFAFQKINWHFIPPGSPSFGGLWEVSVKSMKHHLKRIVGDSILT